MGGVDPGEPAGRAAEPDDTGAAALLTRREHLVADEDVPAVPPARVRAADEARAPGELDLLVELVRSEEHTSELQSRSDLVCRLLLEKKKKHSAITCHDRVGDLHDMNPVQVHHYINDNILVFHHPPIILHAYHNHGPHLMKTLNSRKI